MTLFRLLMEGTRALERAGTPNAKQDAQQLLLAAFHLDMVHFLLNRMQELEDSSQNHAATELYREMIGRRQRRCPLQQILGSQEFMGMLFFVNRHVLIPRQDTETLVEQVLADTVDWEADAASQEERCLLDLCTGSGCIAVSLAARGRFSCVTATDISEEALEVARRNIGALLPEWRLSQEMPGKKERCIRLFCGDLFAALQEEGERYDVITSNPPYIPTAVIGTLEPEVKDHEPILALDGEADGLSYYRKIIANAGGYLKAGGRIYLEIGFDQGPAVCSLLEEAGYQDIRVHRDLPGKDRVVSARWPKEKGKSTIRREENV